MSWEIFNTVSLILSSVVVGMGFAGYLQSRTGNNMRPDLAIGLTLLGASGVITFATRDSFVAVVLGAFLALAALVFLSRTLDSSNHHAT